MGPIRILILAILFYIVYRLIAGGGKDKTAERDRRADSGKTVLSDTLEEDPICNKLVPRRQAVQLQYNGKTYYFCSQECCKLFRIQQGEDE